MTVPGTRGRGRLYWLACRLLVAMGIAGLVLVIAFPPERFDAEGHLIGEMPPAFGLAFAMVEIGLLGILAGLAWTGLGWLWRRRRHKSADRTGAG